MALAHFVLIHTICHGAWVWYKLVPLLEAAGHNVTTLDLAASGIDQRQIEQIGSFDDYSEPLLTYMASIPKGKKVILVGESCGGLNIAIVADKYPEKIAAAVFHNSLMPDIEHNPAYVVDKLLQVFPDWKDTVYSAYDYNGENITALNLGFELMKENIYTNCPIEIENYKPDKVYVVPGGDHKLMLSKRIELFQILNEVANTYA
ncbi:hypothetical protein GH714_034798 [Hevea brasiliensis]|uniref:AB hydrolase-1 domain-containing protein n=1 Tax=Hevea brasiliensis TaxID=3981 RepID=A0A6A6KWR7_HEVBR|nr:hypothetical protein GH714_034798 [Hevea brasiliensis]